MCDGQAKCAGGNGGLYPMAQKQDPRYRQLTDQEIEKIAAVCHEANRAYRAGIGELALLIRDALPRGSKMDPAEILEVLDAATALGARYTRKVP